MGCGVRGLGFRVQGVVSRVQGVGLRVQGVGCRVQGVGFRVQGVGLRVSVFRRAPVQQQPRAWRKGSARALETHINSDAPQT